MKYTWILILAVSSCAFAQDAGNVVFQGAGGVAVAGTVTAFGGGPRNPVQGAPYSATITNESVETLADGNRIVQNSTGTTARDSQGRTRQDTALPAIGDLSAADAPHIVFIQDPVAQTTYTLNLTDKTAQKMPMLPGGLGGFTTATGSGVALKLKIQGPGPDSAQLPPPSISVQGVEVPAPPVMALQKVLLADAQAQVTTESLGSQTMEGVFVTGVRTTRTIPVGQIGNERPIDIVTEVWTSPDLKTVVYSKRSDPRTGEQTFSLTNIVRADPDPSLFSVPADFKIIDGPKPILYRSNQ